MHRTHDVRLAISGTEAAMIDADAPPPLPPAHALALPPLPLSARGGAVTVTDRGGGGAATSEAYDDAALRAQLLVDAVAPYERPPRWQAAAASPRHLVPIRG